MKRTVWAKEPGLSGQAASCTHRDRWKSAHARRAGDRCGGASEDPCRAPGRQKARRCAPPTAGATGTHFRAANIRVCAAQVSEARLASIGASVARTDFSHPLSRGRTRRRTSRSKPAGCAACSASDLFGDPGPMGRLSPHADGQDRLARAPRGVVPRFLHSPRHDPIGLRPRPKSPALMRTGLSVCSVGGAGSTETGRRRGTSHRRPPVVSGGGPDLRGGRRFTGARLVRPLPVQREPWNRMLSASAVGNPDE